MDIIFDGLMFVFSLIFAAVLPRWVGHVGRAGRAEPIKALFFGLVAGTVLVIVLMMTAKTSFSQIAAALLAVSVLAAGMGAGSAVLAGYAGLDPDKNPVLSVFAAGLVVLISTLVLPLNIRMISKGAIAFGLGAIILGLQTPMREEQQPQDPAQPGAAPDGPLLVPAGRAELNDGAGGGRGKLFAGLAVAAVICCAGIAFLALRGKKAPDQRPAAAAAVTDVKAAACKAGDQEACYAVGREMMEGSGRPADADTGRRLLRSACFGGSNSACHYLAYLHMTGSYYCPKDQPEGVRLYQKACDAGYGLSCYNLAFAYARGEGVEKDMSGSMELMEDACAKKYQPACDLLAKNRR